MSLADSVQAGLDALGPLDARDQAVADLALLLAARIDDTDDWADKQRDPLAELAPKLLACLTALGMTPAARKAALQTPEKPAKSRLDELQERRAARQA